MINLGVLEDVMSIPAKENSWKVKINIKTKKKNC